MDLNEMLVFARVVQTGSFTTAATDLGMPKSTVSRRISELEDRLKARLLQRNTRKLSLTDAGRTYYAYCARIVGEVQEAEHALNGLQDTPRGMLRVSFGIDSAFLAPIVTAFLKGNPEVQLELQCARHKVDLVEEGFDLAIRAGTLADSSLIARGLGKVRWFLVGAPAYLEGNGHPRFPEELSKHTWLLPGLSHDDRVLRLENGTQCVHLTPSPRMLSSDDDIVYAAAIEGLGIALLPAFRCVADLRAGRLELVLRDWKVPSTPVHIIYPSTRNLSPLVRSFVEYLRSTMTPPPWELGPAP
jgi:DNA-binding transcriptional LysR family regulator